MYRGTPYLNRNIKKREQQRSMEYHMSNLTQIRPMTGTLEYSNDGPVHINKKKAQMQKQARFTQIQRENRILLEKISSIMGKNNGRRGQSQQKINRSLNSQLRKRQLQNIEVQNAKLLKRLQQRKPNYQTQKFKQSWKKQKYVIKNLSNYPFIISDKKRKRSSLSQIGGRDPKTSNSNTIQLCRMRVIDGVNFLVTVRLTGNKLQIIGDTKDKKQIKVIEIQRRQAIQFIQQQCQGKIQKVFDCLRYDKVDEVMYLVANEVDVDDVKEQEQGNKNKRIKKQENPQFDFSVQNNNNQESNHLPGQIPIHVTNGNEAKKYWVQVSQDKKQQKILKNVEKTNKEKDSKITDEPLNNKKEEANQKHQQKQEDNFQQFRQQKNERKQLKSKQGHRQHNRRQSGTNTYQKIDKLEQNQEQEHRKLAQDEKNEQKKQRIEYDYEEGQKNLQGEEQKYEQQLDEGKKLESKDKKQHQQQAQVQAEQYQENYQYQQGQKQQKQGENEQNYEQDIDGEKVDNKDNEGGQSKHIVGEQQQIK